jgi:hypothetical protein
VLAVVRPARIELPCRTAGQGNSVAAGEITDPDIGGARAFDERRSHPCSIRTQVERGEPAKLALDSAFDPASPIAPCQALIRDDRAPWMMREHARLGHRKGAEVRPCGEFRRGCDGQQWPGHAASAQVETPGDKLPAAQKEQMPRGIQSIRFVTPERRRRAAVQRSDPQVTRFAWLPEREVKKMLSVRKKRGPAMRGLSLSERRNRHGKCPWSCRDLLQREGARHEHDDVVAIPRSAHFVVCRSLR